jgi:hypothetical protein
MIPWLWTIREGTLSMLKLNKDQLRQPYGGHQYYERGLLIAGDSFDDVKKKLIAFRLNNNIPEGDAEQDILHHYLKNWPWMVQDDSTRKPREEQPDYVAWRKWIYRIWNNPPNKIVSSKQASDRWEICKTCPFNKGMEWEETNESSELARRAFLLRRGIEVPKNLGFCSLHKWDLGVANFIENPKELSQNDNKTDNRKCDQCWVNISTP